MLFPPKNETVKGSRKYKYKWIHFAEKWGTLSLLLPTEHVSWGICGQLFTNPGLLCFGDNSIIGVDIDMFCTFPCIGEICYSLCTLNITSVAVCIEYYDTSYCVHWISLNICALNISCYCGADRLDHEEDPVVDAVVLNPHHQCSVSNTYWIRHNVVM